MQAMTQEEILKAGTAIGPTRLRELLFRFVRQSRAPATATQPMLIAKPVPAVMPEELIPVILTEVNDKTFSMVARDKALAANVRAQLRMIHNLRAAAPRTVCIATSRAHSRNQAPARQR